MLSSKRIKQWATRHNRKQRFQIASSNNKIWTSTRPISFLSLLLKVLQTMCQWSLTHMDKNLAQVRCNHRWHINSWCRSKKSNSRRDFRSRQSCIHQTICTIRQACSRHIKTMASTCSITTCIIWAWLAIPYRKALVATMTILKILSTLTPLSHLLTLETEELHTMKASNSRG